MQHFFKNHTTALADMAQRHGVLRLDVFGSAATGRFDEQHSDLDFLVVFRDDPPAAWPTPTSACWKSFSNTSTGTSTW